MQVFIRWDNQIPVNDTDFPSTEKPWYVDPEYVMDICKERTKRTGHPVPGKGRGVAVHHHGMNTVASSDGFAEDVFCAGESKVQALSSSVASTFWYHAHALGITSEDNYNGLQVREFFFPKLNYFIFGCFDPINIFFINKHKQYSG